MNEREGRRQSQTQTEREKQMEGKSDRQRKTDRVNHKYVIRNCYPTTYTSPDKGTCIRLKPYNDCCKTHRQEIAGAAIAQWLERRTRD